jgi:hypothetical protein
MAGGEDRQSAGAREVPLVGVAFCVGGEAELRGSACPGRAWARDFQDRQSAGAREVPLVGVSFCEGGEAELRGSACPGRAWARDWQCVSRQSLGTRLAVRAPAEPGHEISTPTAYSLFLSFLPFGRPSDPVDQLVRVQRVGA